VFLAKFIDSMLNITRGPLANVYIRLVRWEDVDNELCRFDVTGVESSRHLKGLICSAVCYSYFVPAQG
jgi:hypothetical protein